jgi:5-methylcytosine-specific restriction endonuclease McrA
MVARVESLTPKGATPQRSVCVMKQPVISVPFETAVRLPKSMEILVLNKVWYPINLVPATRGLCMLFEGSAHAVDESFTQHDFDSWLTVSDTQSVGGEYIQTPSRRILVPEVIVLRRFDKIPKTKAKLSRANIYKRDGFRCQYCGQHLSRAKLTIDHVHPKSKRHVSPVTPIRRTSRLMKPDCGSPGLLSSPMDGIWLRSTWSIVSAPCGRSFFSRTVPGPLRGRDLIVGASCRPIRMTPP